MGSVIAESYVIQGSGVNPWDPWDPWDWYIHLLQLMVNCWFGLVVWDYKGTPK